MAIETKEALPKIIIEGQEYELPRQVINRGQFSVSVAAPERKGILVKLLKKAKTHSVGQAAWKAILAYVGEEPVDS
jgi:hypothetical protein